MNILDRYGIKEVADVTFYEISETGAASVPVLYLDTLKVSTIEQTAEEAEAKGGKGNAPLIIWDYGKEITVTLEDALFSAKSMAIMFGNGQVKELKSGSNVIAKTEQFVASEEVADTGNNGANADGKGWSKDFTGPDGKIYSKKDVKFYEASGKSTTKLTQGQRYFCSFNLAIEGAEIEVSANSFPGTYYVTGDTYARSETTGKDEFFQFIIPKAKVQSENTITLEAEGDPSVFNMNLRVMRPTDGVMMKLVKYSLTGGSLPASVSVSDGGLGK